MDLKLYIDMNSKVFKPYLIYLVIKCRYYFKEKALRY